MAGCNDQSYYGSWQCFYWLVEVSWQAIDDSVRDFEGSKSLNQSIQQKMTQGAEIVETIEIQAMIKKELPDAEVLVQGEGCSFSVVVVSARFEGCTLLKKQQMVLESVQEALATGALHAISVKAFTPQEWQRR